MSNEKKTPCGECGHSREEHEWGYGACQHGSCDNCTYFHEPSESTVPASEHQRLQAEATAREADCAAMRRALLGVVESMEVARQIFGKESIPAGAFDGAFLGVGRTIELALSSSAGSALLAEMEEMRAKAETERRRVDSLLREANEARAESATLRARLETVEKEREEMRERMLADFRSWRGIRGEPCKKCDGAGVRAYASTTTWRGGIGGQAITNGVCDACWGSGDPERPGGNLREHASKVRRAVEEAVAKERAEIARVLDLNHQEALAAAIRARGGK